MADRIIEIVGTLLGLLYLYYEYKADTRLWIVGVIMPLISGWVYFNAGLYADFAIAIYYFLAALYGYWRWTHSRTQSGFSSSEAAEKEKPEGKDNGGSIPVSHIPAASAFAAAGVTLLLWAAIYFILSRLTNSTVPLCDAFTTALSITGMYLLAQKYVEQWAVWVVVDIVSTGLYFYKGIYFYSGLYGVYTVVALMGYMKWLRLIPETDSSSGK